MSFVDWDTRLQASVEALKSDCDELQRALPKTPDKLPRPLRRSVVSFLAMARNFAAKADENARAGDSVMAWENVAHGRECAYTAAMQILGVQLAQPHSLAGQVMNDRKHARNRDASAKVPDRWRALQAEGLSKNEAARVLASELSLAESTVRDKLKGL